MNTYSNYLLNRGKTALEVKIIMERMQREQMGKVIKHGVKLKGEK
jgi:hypothetical protein